MLSEYEASILSAERTNLDTRRWIDPLLTAYLFAIGLVAIVALALAAAKIDRPAIGPQSVIDIPVTASLATSE